MWQFICLFISLTLENAFHVDCELREKRSTNPDSPILDSGFLEGDIVEIESEVMFESWGTLFISPINRNVKWPKPTIPYIIHHSLRKRAHRIKKAMAQINTQTCVQFVQRTNEKDYIFIYKGRTCSSPVGWKRQGKQNLSLSDSCKKIGNMLHELLHSIGFLHEHTRPDRDKYIKINWDNIEEGKERNFQINNWHKVTTLEEDYDFDSVMHYAEDAWAKAEHLKTIEPLSGKHLGYIANRRKLSKGDIRKINKLYSCNN